MKQIDMPNLAIVIIISSCFLLLPSGHGFKLSPVIGKMLCELALDLPPSYDLSPFKVNRFQNIGAKL